MLKNKWLGIMVALVLVLSCLPVSAAETKTQTNDKAYDHALSVLEDLDLLFQTDLSPFEPYEKATRAQFIASVVKMLNFDEAVETMTVDAVFADVPVDAWYTPYITFANRLGLVSGLEGNNFNPMDPITYEQAIKIVVSALGYYQVAEQSGGYPGGYVVIANNLKIMNGINGKNLNSPILQRDMAMMIYNAVNADLLKTVEISAETVVYKNVRNTTLLSERNIFKDSGIVTANSSIALAGESRLKVDEVSIGDEIYSIGNTGAPQLLGFAVEFYYLDDKSNGMKTLLHIEKKDINTEARIECDDIVKGSKSAYEYQNNKRQKARLASDASIIYNGRLANNLKESDFQIKNGYVLLIDNDGDGQYEVVFMNDFETIVVKYVFDKTIYDLYDSNKTIRLDEDDTSIEFNIYDSGGILRDLSYIQEWNVLFVYQSYDINTNKKVYDITVSQNTCKGVIASIQDTEVEGEKVVEMNVDDRGFYSKKYYSSQILPVDAFDDIDEGSTIELCLDADGKIAAIKKVSSQYLYGFYFTGESDITGTRLKIFTQNNKIEILECYKKVEVDKRELDRQAALQALEPVKGQMIQYTTNGRGQINTIDTLIQTPEEIVEIKDDGTVVYDGLRVATYQYSQRYKSKTRTFSGRFNIEADTKVFLIPSDIEDEDLFSCKPATYFSNDSDYKIEAYYNKHDQVRAPMVTIVAKGSGSLGTSDYPEYVTKIIPASNQEDDRGYKLILYGGANLKERYVNSSAKFETKNIKVGDVVRYTLNADNEINYIEKVFDCQTLSLYKDDEPITSHYITSSSTFSYTDAYFVVAGKVLTRTDDIIQVDNNSSLINLYYILDNSPVYLLDEDWRGNPTIKRGSVTDIASQAQFGDDCSYVFIHLSWGEVRSVYVINKKR